MSRRALLLGGGHANVLALPMLAKTLPSDVRLTLASDGRFAPYSGMLPGAIAGQFLRRECLIDLAALCRRHDVEFLPTAAANICGRRRTVTMTNGAEEKFDALSVNVGGAPSLPFDGGTAVKPAAAFMDWLDGRRLQSAAIVGGGVGGVEIALALRRRFASAELFLVGVSLLPATNAGVRERLRKTLAAKKIEVVESAAANYENKLLSLQDGRQLQAEEVIFTTPVSAPAWLRESDLALDGGGFVRVNGCLQSESAAAVFAAGDCAASGAPKSGAAAVRQAPLLAANIAAFLRGLPLKQWTDRQRLYIINTADGGAVAGWGEWSASGRWVWRWKKYLDQKFMNRFPRPSADSEQESKTQTH